MRMLLLILLLAAPAAAAPPPKPKPAAVKPAEAARFAAAASTWADIQVQVRDLAAMVKEKRLDEIHPVAFEIRDLVRQLRDQSPLPAAGKQKLAAQSRVMDRLAEQLDRYADAGKFEATVRQQQAVLRSLAEIKTLFPAGVLTSHAAAPAGTAKDRELYLTPGGIYTQADIQANGNQLPAVRFRGVKVNHDIKPKAGDRLCPITLTKANPGYAWTVGGKTYLFCCPPCVEEFVRKAKEGGQGIKAPEEYIQK
jgi:YHS domain-containing protein